MVPTAKNALYFFLKKFCVNQKHTLYNGGYVNTKQMPASAGTLTFMTKSTKAKDENCGIEVKHVAEEIKLSDPSPTKIFSMELCIVS